MTAWAHRRVPHPDHGLAEVAPGVVVAAAAGAAIVLIAGVDGQTLDYGVGVVPAAVPWLAAGLAVALALVGQVGRRATSAQATSLIGLVLVATAWSITMLPFDALRLVGLVPFPWSGSGIVLRSLLLVAAAAAVLPVIRERRASAERCPRCRRVLPGRLDRLPAWVAVVALVGALPYPILRTIWALGGTFGTSGRPLNLDPAVAWGVTIAGATLVAVTLVLLADRGPSWVRAVIGLGSVGVGAMFAVMGGLGAVAAAGEIAATGIQSEQGDGIWTWTFVLVYGSWFVAGLGVLAAGWRYWAHRRRDCAGCRDLLRA